MKLFYSIIFIFIFVLFTGCNDKEQTKGASKIHWDRDMCARCVMVVSDRKNTVQLKDPNTHKQYVFDDIGCTILWFKDEKIPWRDTVKIWINDIDTGEWIDARTAFWDTSNITPMAYGFSAHKDKTKIKKGEEIIDFNEVIKRVIKIGK